MVVVAANICVDAPAHAQTRTGCVLDAVSSGGEKHCEQEQTSHERKMSRSLRLVLYSPAMRLTIGIALLLLATACRTITFPVEVKGEGVIAGDPTPIPGLLNALPALSGFTN